MEYLTEIIRSLRERGVKLWVENEQLRCQASMGVLFPEQITLLRELKGLIVSSISGGISNYLIGRDTLLPLAVQHEGFLKLCTSYPNWSFYISTELRLRGILRVEILEKCLSLIIRRHSSLRTRIVRHNGALRQRFSEARDLVIQLRPIVDTSQSGIERVVQSELDGMFNKATDMEAGPLFEFRLLRISEYDHVMVAAIHHAVSDAVSFALFFNELWSAYGDLLHGRDVTLPEVIVQYSEYALWQRLVYFPRKGKCGEYWVSRLSGSAPIKMPVKRVSNDGWVSNYGETEILFGELLSSAVHEFSRSVRSTPAIVVLALYAASVSFWCNQTDFILGVGAAGRFRPEHMSVMGLLASWLPIRVQLRGDETFIDVLECVSREVIAAYEHIDFGQCGSDAFPEMLGGTTIAWLGDSAEIAGVPDNHLQNSLGPDLTVEPLRVRSARTEDGLPEGFDFGCEILWEFLNTPGGIAGRAFYRSEQFSVATMARFTGYLRGRVEQLIHKPHVPIVTFNTSA
jgi:Condensation domain/TubC N-terminal docking domain